MTNLLTFFFKTGRTPSPFQKTEVKTKFKLTEAVEPVDNVKNVSWGLSKIVKAKEIVKTDSIEWTMTNDKAALKSVNLDKYDLDIIQQYNLSKVNYERVKPYVLTENYSNNDIASKLKRSKSWVERLTPKIKKAAAERQKRPLSH